MPFTFSHASAIIPFHRKPYVLSALVTGSFSPDFLYYLPLLPNYEATHSIAGLFLFCLPSSLLVLWIYHQLIKLPLLALLPEPYRSQLWRLTENFRFFPLSQFGYIVLSILIGAATHLVWDSFTHAGHADTFLPWLSFAVLTVFGKTMTVLKLLQYISSVLGLWLFCGWFYRLTLRQKPSPLPMANPIEIRINPLMLFASSSLTFGLGIGTTVLLYNGTFRYFLKQVAVAGIGMFFFLLIFYSCFWHWQSRHHR
jgi:Domain of unknown function (DUF4184)